jgi:predicted nucleic acid-binding protein
VHGNEAESARLRGRGLIVPCNVRRWRGIRPKAGRHFENVQSRQPGEHVDPRRIAACRDPTDDKFLELAVNGHADLLVTGDGDLLALDPFRQIPIVTPAAFVQGVAR